VRSDSALENLEVSSKFDVRWSFLCELRDRGRAEADAWLKANGDQSANAPQSTSKASILACLTPPGAGPQRQSIERIVQTVRQLTGIA
jgi:hypothetical protein